MAALVFITADQLATALGLPGPDAAGTVQESADAANEWLTAYLTPEDPTDSHLDYAYLTRAALMVGVDMYAAPKASGGQSMDAEFSPSPYLMGSALGRRVAGLTAPRRPVSGMAV